MRLTRFTDNALRCLIYLAVDPQRTATIGDVASSMRVSEDHLLKVVRRLVELGYVQTLRGRHGGVRLARAPETINVGAVVRATEDNLTLVPCFDPATNTCPIAAVCVLARCFDDALRAFFAVLAESTLADLAQPRQEITALISGSTRGAAFPRATPDPGLPRY
jgi:Rrf2 family nitric oxide-sensitive transcriptional repressor